MGLEHVIHFMAVTDTDFADDDFISREVMRLLTNTCHAFTHLNDSEFDWVSSKLKAMKIKTNVLPLDILTVDSIIGLYANMKSGHGREMDPNTTFTDSALLVIADFCLCCIERITMTDNVELMAA